MTVFVYYTPHISAPINDRRSGTLRVGWNDPEPIRVTRGWDEVLHFAFRDYIQRTYNIIGQSITARLYNTENVEVWNGTISPTSSVDAGIGFLVIGASATESLSPGLYSLIIEFVDNRGRTRIAQTAQSKPRFIVEILDQTTVDLNI